MAQPIIRIEHLRVHFFGSKYKPILEDISFNLRPGEVLGIIGESGAGKSITARAVLGMLPDKMKFVGGRILFRDREITNMCQNELNSLRGSSIFIIFQNHQNSFNPVMTVGAQFKEFLSAHKHLHKKNLNDLMINSLKDVSLDEPQRIMKSYPHQLSGGQLQRVFIAFALALRPDVLIFDEATSALDKKSENEILQQINKLKQRKIGILFISHNIKVVEQVADNIAVFYGGETIEYGETQKIIDKPRHPYTKALFAAVVESTKKEKLLAEVPGEKTLISSAFCNFHNRCPKAMDHCAQKKPELKDGARCFLYE